MVEAYRAQTVADRLVDNWRHECQKISIAGSLRRKNTEVKDIEIVALPRFHIDLFGDSSDEDYLIPLIREDLGKGIIGVLGMEEIHPGYHANAIKLTAKYLKLIDNATGIPIDLFIVRPPANYYWQLMIRTGPWQYSKWLVNQPKRFGWFSKNGAVWMPNEDMIGDLDGTHKAIEFTSEKHVCDTLGIKYLSPEKRR